MPAAMQLPISLRQHAAIPYLGTKQRPGGGRTWRRSRPFVSACLAEAAQKLSSTVGFTELEGALVEALIGVQGRGRGVSRRQLQVVENAVRNLEASGGVPDPTRSSLIEGSWQLMFTTRPGTASPIQRTFVGVDSFKIFQELYLNTNDPRVTNVVKFSEAVGELRVEAAATAEDGKRILFQFDRAAFSFKFLPFKVPYPVPFRFLGDEAKGWLETTYLSQTGIIRISRGNKGTTFVLQKAVDLRQVLLSAISSDTGVAKAVDELVSSGQKQTQVDPKAIPGEWKLLWASKMETDSWISRAACGLRGSLQKVTEDLSLENSVLLIPGLSITMSGNLVKGIDSNAYSVTMEKAAILIGGRSKIPLKIKINFNMVVLYVDRKIRVTKVGEVTLVHLRVD